MYVLKIVNTFTEEILREESYRNPDLIESILDSCINGSTDITFLIDRQKRILRAVYCSYKVIPDGNDLIYKLFFRIQKVEAKI